MAILPARAGHMPPEREALFILLSMKVRMAALAARGDVTWLMKMQLFATLIANQRS